MRKVHAAAAVVAIAGLILPATVSAQSPTVPTPGASPIPGSIEPGRLLQRLQPTPDPAAAPDIVTPPIPESAPPVEASETRFQLQRIVIDESTVYSEEQIRPLYAELLGKTVSLADIYRVADAVTVKYRSDGYILSRAVVPAQRISQGAVHLRAVEGFIQNVIIQGGDNAKIASYADIAKRSRPLRAEDIERCLLLINDLPGVNARGVLSPSTGVTGGSNLTIVVEKKRMNAFVSLDNRGTKYIGPLQLFADVGFNDLTDHSDRLGFRYITTPADEPQLRYFEFNYTRPIGGDGTTLLLSGSFNRSLPGSTLQSDALRTMAKGETIVARLSHPLIRTRRNNLVLDASLTMRNASVDQRVRASNARLISSYQDRLRELAIDLSYDHLDGWKGRNFARVELTQGLPILNASESNRMTDASHPGGLAVFTKGTLEASRLQSLDAVFAGLDLLGAVSGGGSFGQALLASEQFGIGGPQYGRGYDPSELTGDYGLATKLELQYTFRPKFGGLPRLAQLLEGVDTFVQLYTFFDYGAVWDQNPELLGQPDKARSLASTGIGIRANMHDRFLGSIEASKGLTRRVATLASNPNPKPFRIYFSVIGKF